MVGDVLEVDSGMLWARDEAVTFFEAGVEAVV
jgi:hypothetical protein